MAVLTDKQIAEIENVVQSWDIDKSIKRASEEFIELALSLLHFGRNKANTDDVLSEMADAHIALIDLEIKFGSYQDQLNVKVRKCN